MPYWEMDGSEPLVSPENALEYYGKLMGGADLGLPPVLIATFQTVVLEHLGRRLDLAVSSRWPAPAFFQLARATLDDREIAIARLPIGAPAAALALELMIAAGVRSAFIVGSAGSLRPDLPAGSIAVPSSAVRHDGTSHHYLAAGEPAEPSPVVAGALLAAAARRGITPVRGPIWTTDAPYRECAGTVTRLREEGVLAVEMEAAALFAVARHRGVDAGLIVSVSDELGEEWRPSFHSLAYRRGILAAADIALDAAAAMGRGRTGSGTGTNTDGHGRARTDTD
ncbi:MAG TPA: phosphorylase [Chloroflexota bacterium]